MSPPLLLLRNIHLTFGTTPLLEAADLTIAPGEKLCLVGRNGSGKSTLLKVGAGLLEPESGEIFIQPNATVRYLPQEPDLSKYDTTLAYVAAGLSPGDDLHRARYLLEQLGLSGEEHPKNLSGGEARRSALARVLAPAPDILLLDEPTNHLDLAAIEWLENELANLRSALVLISHDRRFLQNLAQTTIWLDRGTTRRFEQNFARFEEWRDNILEQEELNRHKLDRKIVAEQDWLRHGVSGRRKRNQGRLRALQTLRQEKREQRRATGKVQMQALESENSGKLVIETKSITKAYGEAVIVRDLSLRIQRGDKLGIIGPNGAGKTTLLNLLTGALNPDKGSIRLGANLNLVTLDQRRESLEAHWTLSQALTGGTGDTVSIGEKSRHVVSYMKDFLFTPEQANTPIKVLSGGERGRLMLARALARPSNLLVLDEPTNDLDLETLDLLQEMLSDYPGTVLLVSHDRDFLDRVASSVLVAEGNGSWTEYAGGYSDMLAQRGSGRIAKTSRTPAKPEEEAKISSPVSTNPQKRKLSFKEKHALETLPDRIANLQSKINTLQETLADPEFYRRDPSAFDRTSQALSEAQNILTAAEEEWLMLEMLREEVESLK